RLVLPTTRRQPLSPLFPYTTLFRSVPHPVLQEVPCRRAGRSSSSSTRSAGSSPHWRSPPTPRRWCAASTSPGSSTCGGCRSQVRSEEHTSELQSRENLVCRLLLEKK